MTLSFDLLKIPRRLSAVDVFGIAMIILSGTVVLFPSFLEFNHELIPLVLGISFLLVGHSREEPIRIVYLWLFLLTMRIYLHSDERYLSWEIVLSDYIMIVVAFAASFRMAIRFWSWFFTLYAFAMPCAGLISLLYFLASQPDGPFDAGDLSINQTAFLFGSCLTIAGCFLWRQVFPSSPQERKASVIIPWAFAALISAVLVLSTQSRAAFGLPWIAILVILVTCERVRLLTWINQVNSSLFKDRSEHTKAAMYIAAFTGMALSLVAVILLVYSNMDNMVSDVHRLHLLRCYFGGMFAGNNSFLYGLGFTRASQGICMDVGIIKGTTHAHNLFAQVAADNGFPALLFLCILVFLFFRVAGKRIPFIENPVIFASLTLSLYCFLFLLVEGGWGKVPFIQALLGLTLASLTMRTQSPQEPEVLYSERYALDYPTSRADKSRNESE